jgi:LysM repeat protein
MKMKTILLAILLSPFFLQAQDAPLLVQGTAGNYYLNHTAAAKESFYSIGRLYNISPKEIAPYNSLTLEKGLTIGQAIKIPLKEVNFVSTDLVMGDEAAVPLNYLVQGKETLYAISTKFNKVPVGDLKRWNDLNTDALSTGKQIIIGFLKVKKELSALATNGIEVSIGTKTVESETTSPNPPIETKEEVVVKKPEPKKVIKEEVVPVVEKVVAKKIEAPVKKEKIAEQKIEEKVVTVVPKKEAVVSKKVEEKVATVVPKKEVVVAKKVEEIEESVADEKASAKDFKGGVFKVAYTNNGNESLGTAGIFKSTSGWEDGKYYCLHNEAEQNTIIKITNKANGKFIYAKVLDVIPDLKQNANVLIRVSNAAADVLGAGAGSNFQCSVSY